MSNSGITLKQWCYDNNSDLLNYLVDKNDSIKYSYASHVKVNWICSSGHVFDKEIFHFTTKRSDGFIGFKCPVCNGKRIIIGINDLATTRPDLALEWNYERNKLTPQQVTKGSYSTVWWKCRNNHEWRARISSRDYGNGCPFCASTPKTSLGEQYVLYYMKRAFKGHEVLGNYRINTVEFDVYIPDFRLAIEFDGNYWHSINDTDYKFNYANNLGISLFKVIESDRTYIDGNKFYFRYNSVIQKSELNKVLESMIILFNNLYNSDIISIDLGRDYGDVRKCYASTNTSNTVRKWIQKLRPYWDVNLNGYEIDYIQNDGGDKFWRCEFGHSFKRRLDVIDRNNGLRCPCCTGRYSWRFYCFYFNNTYIIFDVVSSEIESVSLDIIKDCISKGINIRGIIFSSNILDYDFSYISKMSNTAFRGVFDKYRNENIACISNNITCLKFLNYFSSCIKSCSNIDKFKKDLCIKMKLGVL